MILQLTALGSLLFVFFKTMTAIVIYLQDNK